MNFFPGRRIYLTLFIVTLALASTSCCSTCDLHKNDDFAGLEQKVDRLDSRLTEEAAALRGEVHQLDEKIAELKAPPPQKEIAAPAPEPAPTVTPAEAPALYKQAREKYLRSQYQEAAELFERLAAGAPRHKLAPNARYWLAECYYSRRQFQEAVTQFDKVIQDYPASDKAPDAMLKLAYSFHMLQDGHAAMTHLRNLLQRYPKSRAAEMVRKGQTVFQYP